MKKTIIIIMAIACMISLTVTSSNAGSKERKRFEKFLIGSSAGLLGAVLLNNLNHNRARVSTNEPGHHRKYRRSYRHRHNGPKGHWKVEKIWVEPEYEERWNPGHYNKKGEWKSGRYQKFIVREGYWKEKRIWIAYY